MIEQIWTFELVSGPPIKIELPNHPALEFNGHHTIWKLRANKQTAHALRDLLQWATITANLFIEEDPRDMEEDRPRSEPW